MDDVTMEIDNGKTTINGTPVPSCPGLATYATVSSTKGIYCCVEKDPSTMTASMCEGFPFCSTKSGSAMVIPTPSCEALVPITATDYSLLIASATKGLSGAKATTTNTAAPGSSTKTTASQTASAAAAASGKAGNGASGLSAHTGTISMGFGLLTAVIAFIL